MLKRTMLRGAVCALALQIVPGFALPLAAEEAGADTVVATVGGTEITLGHMITVRAGLPEQYQQLPPDVLWDGILDQLIQQEALAQDDLARETRRVTLSLDNERRSLLAAETITAVAENAVSEEAIQTAFDTEYKDAPQGREFNAAHILVETEDAAKAIVEEVSNGADFAETAKAKSTGPSGPNGGALGWFGEGQMVAPFETAVQAMQPGEVSDPVQTQFGWHVIKLNETRDLAAPKLDEVREQIMGKLRQEAVQTYIDEAVTRAEVSRADKGKFDPTLLTNIELLED